MTLCAGEARACITALLDTGNSLIEPISKKPVCLLESGVLERLVDKEAALMRAVPYCSVGCEKGILYAVEIPKMQIACDGKVKEVQDVFCAEVPHKLATNDTYKMILHPECVGEI